MVYDIKIFPTNSRGFFIPPDLRDVVANATRGTDTDTRRYEELVYRKVREEVRRFISPQKMQILKGGKLIQLPFKKIELPQLARGGPFPGGIGSGKGDIGQQIGQLGQGNQPRDPNAPDGGVNQTGEHFEEHWTPPITRSEIARMLMDDLELPNLEAKGDESIRYQDIRWNSIARHGAKLAIMPTMRNAVKLGAMAVGPGFTAHDIVPDAEAQRFYSYREEQRPRANAVIFYLMDVSYSMKEKQREIARVANFYLSTLIQHKFGVLNSELRGEKYTDAGFGEGVQEVFIIHEFEASEVSENDFYHTNTHGGTKLASAYEVVHRLIEERFNPQHWNIYVFHESDGDTYGGHGGWADIDGDEEKDDEKSIRLIKTLLPKINAYGFINIHSDDAVMEKGYFRNVLEDQFGTKDNKVRITYIEDGNPEEYRSMLKTILSKRKGDLQAA